MTSVPNDAFELIFENLDERRVVVPAQSVARFAAALLNLFRIAARAHSFSEASIEVPIVAATVASIHFHFSPVLVSLRSGTAPSEGAYTKLGAISSTVAAAIALGLISSGPPNPSNDELAIKVANLPECGQASEELVASAIDSKCDLVRLILPDGREITLVGPDKLGKGYLGSRPSRPPPGPQGSWGATLRVNGELSLELGPVSVRVDSHPRPESPGVKGERPAFLGMLMVDGETYRVVAIWNSQVPARLQDVPERYQIRGQVIQPAEVAPLEPVGTQWRDADLVIVVNAVATYR